MVTTKECTPKVLRTFFGLLINFSNLFRRAEITSLVSLGSIYLRESHNLNFELFSGCGPVYRSVGSPCNENTLNSENV